MNTTSCPVSGTGLGLRREFIDELITGKAVADFYEVAPENWMEIGGALGKKFTEFAQHNPVICHGLSLSIGSSDPLDEDFIVRLKTFFDKHNIPCYSEHLSYCSDGGHLYDLMPIPFTEQAAEHVAGRIKRVQEILERRLIIENVSYYAAPRQEISEIDFLNSVLKQADCDLLLDVNNIYVNSINHNYDAEEFLKSVPQDRIAYIHIAGHYNEAEDLLVDTHGADVIDPVWKLLDLAYQQYGVIPTLLERDFNIPSLDSLNVELDIIRHYQDLRKQSHVAA